MVSYLHFMYTMQYKEVDIKTIIQMSVGNWLIVHNESCWLNTPDVCVNIVTLYVLYRWWFIVFDNNKLKTLITGSRWHATPTFR